MYLNKPVTFCGIRACNFVVVIQGLIIDYPEDCILDSLWSDEEGEKEIRIVLLIVLIV